MWNHLLFPLKIGCLQLPSWGSRGAPEKVRRGTLMAMASTAIFFWGGDGPTVTFRTLFSFGVCAGKGCLLLSFCNPFNRKDSGVGTLIIFSIGRPCLGSINEPYPFEPQKWHSGWLIRSFSGSWYPQFQRIIQMHIVGIQNQTEMETFLLVAHLILHDIHFHTGAVASQGCNSSTSKANKYRFNGFNTSWWHSALFVWGFCLFSLSDFLAFQPRFS